MACLSKPVFPFEKLPLELKFRIFELLLAKGDTMSYNDDTIPSKAPHTVTGFSIPSSYPAPGTSCLAVSRQFRLEYGVQFFHQVRIVLSSRASPVRLSRTLAFLKAVGPVGRSNLRSLSIDWYHPSWPIDKSVGDATARDLVTVLRAFPALQKLEIHVKGLGKYDLKPPQFGKACGLAHLRGLDTVKEVYLHAPTAEMCFWLREGMGGMPLTTVRSAEEADMHEWARGMFN